MKQDEISSTERLLDLIRKQEPQDLPKDNIAYPKKLKQAKPFSSFSFGKDTTIGIEIGHTELKVAKINHLQDGDYELLDFRTIPFAPNTSPDNSGFPIFLKQALENFGVVKHRCALWSAISSVKVEMRCVRIPKLPKKQIPNAVYWVFTKEVAFKKDEEFLDFKVLDEVSEDGVTKLEVMAYAAPQKDIFALRDLFLKADYPLTGISIVPFAVQNLLQTILRESINKNICNLFIGRDWSRIAIYSEGKLVLSRGIKSGMRSMILCISEAIKNKSFKSAQLSLDAYKNIHATLLTQSKNPDVTLAQKIFVNFVRGTLPISRLEKYNILSEDQILKIIEPALVRLVRQVERTFEHYSQHFRNDGLCKILVSGPLTTNEMLIKYLGKQLDLPIAVMDPFPFNTEIKSQAEIPEAVSHREVYMPAIGMALSNKRITPNFLFTYIDREKSLFIEKIGQIVLVISFIGLILMTAVLMRQSHELKNKEAELARSNNRLASYSPEVDKELILKLFSQTKQNNDQLRAASRRLASAALLEEISQITPANIRLISYAAVKNKTKISIFNVSLDGVIFGNRTNFESSLTSFLLRLKRSPLFSYPTVTNKQYEYYDDQEVLRFSVKIDPA